MDSNENISFGINSSGDFVSITPLRLMHADAESSWDKNWIDVIIEIKALPFHGKYNAALMTIDFEKFKQELKRIYIDLSGITMFSCLEDHIEIKIKGDGIGHFEANCIAQHTNSFPPSKLLFQLNFDQTQIVGMINQLDEITKRFPIMGDDLGIKTTK